MYVDAGHLNERGNELVATEMVRRLRACRLLPVQTVLK